MTDTNSGSLKQVSRTGLPRRAFLASGLSAALAAGGAALITLGAATAPMTDTFRFSRGTSFASGEEARLRGLLAEAAKDDRMIVIITGHTGDQGDEQANLSLSQSRAEAAAAIAQSIGLRADQLTVIGVGGGAPLPREDGLSDRAYQSQLARVEVTVQVRR